MSFYDREGLTATEFITAEVLTSHDLMDKAQVPRRNVDGVSLSLSQRVELLAAAYAGMALASATIFKVREESRG